MRNQEPLSSPKQEVGSRQEVTQSEVSNWLHLTEVSGAAIDDACEGSTLIGENCNLGTACEGPMLGTRDHTEPVIGRTLGRGSRVKVK